MRHRIQSALSVPVVLTSIAAIAFLSWFGVQLTDAMSMVGRGDSTTGEWINRAIASVDWSQAGADLADWLFGQPARR